MVVRFVRRTLAYSSLPYPSLAGSKLAIFLAGKAFLLVRWTVRQNTGFSPSYDVVRRFADALNCKKKADLEISQAG